MSLGLIAESYIAAVENNDVDNDNNDELEMDTCESVKLTEKFIKITKKVELEFPESRKRKRRRASKNSTRESTPEEDKISTNKRLCTDIQDSNNAGGGGGIRRSNRRKSKSYEGDVTANSTEGNTTVDLDQSWPFTRCRIVLQLDDDDNDGGEGMEKGKLERGWDLQGTKYVFYDRVTSKEVKQMRDEMESSSRTNLSTSFHLPVEVEAVPVQEEPMKLPDEAQNGNDEELEKSVQLPEEAQNENEEGLEKSAQFPDEAQNENEEELEESLPILTSSRPKRTPQPRNVPVPQPIIRPKRVTTSARRKSRQSQSVEVSGNGTNSPDLVAQTVGEGDFGKDVRVPRLEAVFKCPYCLEIFPQAGELIKHLEAQSCKTKTDEENNDKSNQVKVKRKPEKPAASPKPVVQSKEKESNSPNIQANQDQIGKGNLLCVICGQHFSRIYELDHHMNLHSGETPFKCPLCTERFSDLASTDKHVRIAHSIGNEVSLLELIERSKRRKSCGTGTKSLSPNPDVPALPSSRSRTRTTRKISS